jgi:hypothetical protein
MVHLIHPIGGGRGQSVHERRGRNHVLASPSIGWMWRPFVVDGGGDGLGLSSGFGEVDGDVSFHPQHGLALMWFGELGIEGHLVTGKLIVTLSHPLGWSGVPGCCLASLY